MSVPLSTWPLLLALASTASSVRAATIAVSGQDSAAIQAAVEKASPGDTVQVPAGTFPVAETLKGKSGVRLAGAGAEKTILRFAGKKPMSMMSLGGCEDVEVTGLSLDGGGSPDATRGISAGDARRLRIHHVTVRDLGRGKGPIGVHFSGRGPKPEGGVTDSEIADCLFEKIGPGDEWGAGVRLSWGSSRNRILRNTIRETGRGGIFGNDGSTDLVIQGNTVSGSGGEGLGIELWGGCERSIVEDNRIDHWLSVDRSDGSAIRRNVVGDPSDDYKYIGLELVAASRCVFTDNTVDGGQSIGVSVSNKPPKNHIFWGYNTIQGCNQWGAQLQGEAGGIAHHYFYRCKFLSMPASRGNPRYPGDAGHGFRFNGNARHVTFEECEFRDNGRLGVQIGGPGVDFLRFVRCRIEGNKGAAVAAPRDMTALEWTDCTVTGNGSDALPPAKPFPQPAPKALFEAPSAARAGKPVRFVSGSTAAAGKIAQALWDFNDGLPATGPEATHTFAKPGAYRVTLVVWDEAGRGARTEKRIQVEP
jgi:PKD repeat protein